jgi:hypothetical protein
MEDKMKFNNVAPNHFFKFPNIAVFDGTWGKMSSSARSVFCVLGVHANWKTGECFVSLNRIAEEAGYSRRSVIYGIQELERFNAIAVKRVPGEVNHYILAHYNTNIPPTLDEALSDEALSRKDFDKKINVPDDDVTAPEDSGDMGSDDNAGCGTSEAGQSPVGASQPPPQKELLDNDDSLTDENAGHDDAMSGRQKEEESGETSSQVQAVNSSPAKDVANDTPAQKEDELKKEDSDQTAKSSQKDEVIQSSARPMRPPQRS